jgi:mono/diheme cytochrome c family protein
MRRDYLACLTAAGIVIFGASSAYAAEMTLGEFEYRNSCASCHGAGGKGDGPVGDFLSGAEVPDLTVIQKNNDGVFPVQGLYDVIEGSAGASASIHGSRDMPVWGSRYMARTEETKGEAPFTPEDAERYVHTRILALIEHLATLQE